MIRARWVIFISIVSFVLYGHGELAGWTAGTTFVAIFSALFASAAAVGLAEME